MTEATACESCFPSTEYHTAEVMVHRISTYYNIIEHTLWSYIRNANLASYLWTIEYSERLKHISHSVIMN
jgi:hypothetical protein